MDISDDIKNAYFDGYDNGYNEGFEAGQRDVLLEEMQPSKEDTTSDQISRRAAIDAVMDEFKRTPTNAIRAKTRIEKLPSVQTKGWMERNKERILQAGMEGREIEFRIGGRLFAIREKAQ